jgi:methyl-accepting chemotaxis protein
MVGFFLFGTAIGAGLVVLWLQNPTWSAGATVVVAILGTVAILRTRKAREKEMMEDRNAKQVLLIYREMATMVQNALCHIPSNLAPSTADLNFDLDDGASAKTLVDFSVQVGHILSELLERTSQSGCPLPEVCRFHLESKGKADSFQEFFLKYQTFSEILHSFVDLISASTQHVSTPLSQEILIIKKAVTGFVTDLMSWMQTSQSRSSQEVDSIIRHFGDHTEKISRISDEIRHYNESFRHDLEIVVKQFKLIQERTGRISEISEQVKMLSLNAAIQAARAGEAGKGFKVISGEIQRLSVDVQEIVEVVTEDISVMTGSLNSVLDSFDQDTGLIGKNLAQFNKELSQYDGNLEAYHKAFSEIVNTITTVSNELQGHISNLAPLFQLQDMTLQQVEHLAVLSDRIREEESSNSIPESALTETRKSAIRQGMFALLEQVATTDGELEVIDKFVQRHRLSDTRSRRTTESQVKIEFF